MHLVEVFAFSVVIIFIFFIFCGPRKEFTAEEAAIVGKRRVYYHNQMRKEAKKRFTIDA